MRAPVVAGLLVLAVLPAWTASATAPVVSDHLVHRNVGTGEPQLAIDRLHPQDVVVGENNTGVNVSHDSGRTWAHVTLSNQGDNTTTIDAAGTYAYTSLDGDVQVSKDRGATWSSAGNWVGALSGTWSSLAPDLAKGIPFRDLGCNAPVPVGPVDPVAGPGFHAIGCDRPWLTADATLPGHLAVSFVDHSDGSGGALPETLGCKTSTATNQFFSCGRQYVTTSVDGGATWKPFVPVDAAEAPADYTNGFAGIPQQRGGILASAYLASKAPGSTCSTCVVFQTSANAGATWTRHVVPLTVDGPSLGAHNLNPLGIDSSVAFEPYLAQDPSRAGRYAVMVFDQTHTHLLVQVTKDFGRSWAPAPARLAERGGAARWLPWLAYGSNGSLGAVWRTTTSDGSYTVWAAVSRSGGTTFSGPVRLSSAVSPGPVSQVAGDDASFVALDRTTLHAAWGDRREGTLGIHYGRYVFAATSGAVAGRVPGTSTGRQLPATGLPLGLAILGAVLLGVGLWRQHRTVTVRSTP